MDLPVVDRRSVVDCATETERGDGVDGTEQLAQVARRWEVLVLVRDAHLLDTPARCEAGDDGVDQAVSPSLWWSASNWANRFAIPITFGLPPDTCDILDPRPPTGFYGSELLAQASLQWSPAYCLDKKRFKFQHNQMSDEAGWNLMESGGGAAAVVSSKHDRRGEDPVGYAPTAVTGFSIAPSSRTPWAAASAWIALTTPVPEAVITISPLADCRSAR